MDITGRVANFIVSLGYDEMPDEVISKAKLAMLDCTGVTLAGSTDQASKITGGLVKLFLGQPMATVIGQGFRASIPDAAFVNGTTAHVLDYDDGATLSIPLHPSAPVLPAVMSLGESRKESGKRMIESYVTGYEVEAKLAEAMTTGHYEKGWHTTGTLGTLGAAAAACKILSLGVEETRTALGIAASMVGGLRENFGTMTKPLHAGNAARNGTVAALLAERGYTASRKILDGESGFLGVYGPNGFRIRHEYIETLGRPFSIISPGLSLKPYPSCRATHSSIDGIIRLLKQNPLSPGEVETIECGISPLSDSVLIYSDPHTGNEGKFSLEYCVTRAFWEKEVNLGDFTDEKVTDPDTQKFMKKVKRYPLSEEERPHHHRSAKIKIIAKNGSSYFCSIDEPKGSPTDPMSDEEVRRKFMDCSRMHLPKKEANSVLEMIEKLEFVKDVSELMRLLI